MAAISIAVRPRGYNYGSGQDTEVRDVFQRQLEIGIGRHEVQFFDPNIAIQYLVSLSLQF